MNKSSRKVWQLCDVVATDRFCYRMYCYEKEFAPIAYANLVRLK